MEEEERNDRSTQDGIMDAASDLVKTYRELIKLRIVEKTSLGASISIVGLLLIIVGVLLLLFASLGFAWWIGDRLDNMKAGFFIVGGVYLLILVTLVLMSNSVILPGIRNIIIRKMYEQD